MSPEVYRHIEKILQNCGVRDRIIELGAVDAPDDLIRISCLERAKFRVGVGNSCTDRFVDGIQYFKRDANDLSCFKKASFDLVLCNSMLEHDPLFWKTLIEINRILSPGGRLIIGVPSFEGMGLKYILPSNAMLAKLFKLIIHISKLNYLKASSLTLGEHSYPDDYYRFSAAAVRDVFFKGYDQVILSTVMMPPRIVATGIRKND